MAELKTLISFSIILKFINADKNVKFINLIKFDITNL